MTVSRARIAEVRELVPGDEERLLAAFNGANRAQDAAFVERSGADWRWKYFGNPAGLRAKLGLDENGAVLAQYAGLPQRIRLDGQWTCITQGVDSFSVAGARGLGKRGAFVRTGEPFARDYGGRAGEGDPWMWGFPVPAARRVGERFLGYRDFRAQPLLMLGREPRGKGEAQAMPWSALVEEAPAFDALFEQQQDQYAAIADRGAAALRWRYGPRAEDSPGPYRLLVSRSSQGELRGFAVVTLGEIDGRKGAVLCDLFGPDGCEVELLRAAWRFACDAGQTRVIAALPPWTESFARFQSLGFHVHGSSLLMVGRSYDRSYPAGFWRSNWWTTLGDTDLC